MLVKNQFSLFGNTNIPINSKFVITLTKINHECIYEEEKRRCKILKLHSEWNFNEILLEISKLDPKGYPNLFIFVIETEDFISLDSLKTLKKFLVNFCNTRPIILQLQSKKENKTKIFYKAGIFEDFFVIKKRAIKKIRKVYNFSAFIGFYLNTKIEKLEEFLLNNLPKVQNSSIILRFIKTLELPAKFFAKLILKYAAEGSEADLLVAIDGFIDEKGKLQEDTARNFISYTHNSTSVLHTAVKKSNNDITNFLVKKCTNLIQQLPFDHQVEISTIAYETKQLEVVCDLLESCDFPFPRNIDPKTITNERLLKITKERVEFHDAILAVDLDEIECFIEDHKNLKFAYNLHNKSAFRHALSERKYNAFFFIKSFGLEDRGIKNYRREIKAEDKDDVERFISIQRGRNVRYASSEYQAVMALLSRSLIFRRHRNTHTEEEQWEKVTKWYNEIYNTKFGFQLFDAASQCDELKIIFDFEYKSVENVDVAAGSGTFGIVYPILKFIFVGAKSTEEGRSDQEIKGTIVHEICHYVIRMVFQNRMNPYCSGDHKTFKKFDKIVGKVKNIVASKPKQAAKNEETSAKVAENYKSTDDCDGIISLVYTCYKKSDHHLELIVRPAHIQAHFDDDKVKFRKLRKKFKILFKFFECFVIPEIRKFNMKQRKMIQNFNNVIGLLSRIEGLEIEFSTMGDITNLIDNKQVITYTNVPKLSLLNIFKHVSQKSAELVAVENIFMDTKLLENSHILNSLKDILRATQNLNIFVDCSRGFGEIFKIMNFSKTSRMSFIVTSSKQCETLNKKLNDPINLTLSYEWVHLTVESQTKLLKTKINFQNNPNLSLFDLIDVEIISKSTNDETFSKIFDDQLLNLLVEGLEILINPQLDEDGDDKQLKILFQSRSLIKKYLSPADENEDNMKQTNPSQKVDVNLEKEQNKENSEKSGTIKKIEALRELSQEQMLDDISNKKFVLISDKAGSGKSWILKNFTSRLKTKYPKKWTTYVDLKQFINEFKAQESELDFTTFMTESILKSAYQFEAEIFKKLYKNGQVCILFDGFDEIAPDCAEFVTKLFKSFQQNGQNQLWIATRDYFEVNLREKLELDAVYKLDEFTEQHGVELIASSWVLSEISQECTNLSDNDVINLIKGSKSLQSYKEIASKVSERVTKLQTSSIGFPQFYKMIADISKNNKHMVIISTTFKIFAECVNIQYERWSREKGQLRAKANTASQHEDLSYHKLHQTVAMESLFPGNSRFKNLSSDNLCWTDEEIIACGLLSKKGDKFFFSHETYREFYAADFAISILKNIGTKTDATDCYYLIEFLTIQKFGIVRLFMNEGLGEDSILNIIEPKTQQISKSLFRFTNILENFCFIFGENLTNLAILLFKIFESGDYKESKNILMRNNNLLVTATEHVNLFVVTSNFIVDYFKSKNELRSFLEGSATFLLIISSNLNATAIANFLHTIREKTDDEFMKNVLQMKDFYKANLFFYLVQSNHTDSAKFKAVIQILRAFLSVDEIANFMMNCNKHGENILQICLTMKKEEVFEIIWTAVKEFFTSEDSLQHFEALLNQKAVDSQNILHYAASCEKIEFQQTFWILLLQTFENCEDLKDLMLQNNKNGNNFVHCLVALSKADIIEFAIRRFKEDFNEDQYGKILKSKGRVGRNLLQLAAFNTKDIKIHQFLLQTFRDFCKSDEEFLEILKEVDRQADNIFHLIVAFSTCEVFEFMIGKLEGIMPKEKVGEILSILGFSHQNLFQSAAKHNKSLELHESLWKIIQEYLKPSEIMDMIKHSDNYEDNLLKTTIECNTKEVCELTWNEIKNILKSYEDGPIIEYITHANRNKENIVHTLGKAKDEEKLKYFWNESENIFKAQNSSQNFKTLIRQKTSYMSENILHFAAKCDKIEFHETLWELLLNTLENQDEIMDLMTQKDLNSNKFVNCLVANAKADIIEFTFNKIKEIFNDEQFIQIVKSTGEQGRNLLQTAANKSKELKTHQILWRHFRDSYKSGEEFLKVLKKVDKDRNNVFHIAAAFSTSEIVEFMIRELEKIAAREEITKMLSTLGYDNKNLLQSAATQNRSVELHKKLWEIIRKYFDNSKILDMINHTDVFGNNIFHNVVESNTKHIFTQTWNQIQIVIPSKNDQAEYVNRKGHDGKDLSELSLHNLARDLEVHIWVTVLMREFGKSTSLITPFF